MKIALLGLGFMGSTHLKALHKIPGAEVVAVASVSEQALSGDLSEVQGNLGGRGEKYDFSAIRKYLDAQEAALDPEAEAVDICLPTDQHAPVALAALRAGKHVLVEKPMALDGESADRMAAEAARCGRVLMAAQVVRFLPQYRVTADLLRSGGLGSVRGAFFRRRCAAPAWSAWLGEKARSGGGVFDLLIHDVDFMLHLFGPPAAVSATGYEDLAHGIDWIAAQFRYPRIGSVAIVGGWHHPKAYPFSMEYTITADGGTLEFGSDCRPLTLYTAEGDARALEISGTDGYQAELEYFLECAGAGRRPEFCPPEESAAAIKAARWMVESRDRNGETIACRF